MQFIFILLTNKLSHWPLRAQEPKAGTTIFLHPFLSVALSVRVPCKPGFQILPLIFSTNRRLDLFTGLFPEKEHIKA